jgi:hypothetical protein
METYEGDYSCEVSEDGRCGAIATRIVREPFTPAAVKVLCCDRHAQDLISEGYKADPEADRQLAEDKRREAEYFERDEFDKTLTEGQRLGMDRL